MGLIQALEMHLSRDCIVLEKQLGFSFDSFPLLGGRCGECCLSPLAICLMEDGAEEHAEERQVLAFG